MDEDLPTGSNKSIPVRVLLPDQLGPHFIDDPKQKILLVVPFDSTFGRQMHIQKAVWWMSAILHRIAEADGQIELVECENLESFVSIFKEEAEVIGPTSFQARKAFMKNANFKRLPSRGFVTSEQDFAHWIKDRSGKRFKLEDFYRFARVKHGLLVDEDNQPIGGNWNFDADNRLPPPKGLNKLNLPESFIPQWDQIDELALQKIQNYIDNGNEYLGKFSKNRYFAVNRDESLKALENFIQTRLHQFGPFEDASLTDDWQMAHSLLSAPLNIGLIDPLEMINAAIAELAKGAPINSVEGFVRQILGWRDYVWHLYWFFTETYSAESNFLAANQPLPIWMQRLDSAALKANCLKQVTDDLSDRAWLHHIQRLMILGNWAMQQQINPQLLVDWFDRSFIDGHPWVMAANVIGMSQYADGGRMSTKPYAAGGAYINKMTDFCKGCEFKPEVRVGATACPFTAGYWKFIDRHKESFSKNPRMTRAVYGLNRLKDLDQLLAESSNQS
jgi:deoxyribodipyrimidine photolyase-related protein